MKQSRNPNSGLDSFLNFFIESVIKFPTKPGIARMLELKGSSRGPLEKGFEPTCKESLVLKVSLSYFWFKRLVE